jgi:rhodanese-related sulfurtransferase
MVPQELYNFKNKAGCLVIVYCDDEKESREVAKTFVDRGTDNIFVLSGGMNEFGSEFPFYIGYFLLIFI